MIKKEGFNMKRLTMIFMAVMISFSVVACETEDKIIEKNEGGQVSTPSEKPEAKKVAEDVNQGDPGESDDPQWWGMWMGDGFSIEITEFNEDNFWFEIVNLENTNVVMAGRATLYPDDDYMAEYGDISFSLYDDYSAIDIFEPVTSIWTSLRGVYKMLDSSNPYNIDSSEEDMEDQGNDFLDSNTVNPDDSADNGQSDPGDTAGPQWSGVYTGDDSIIEITRFDGNKFWFEIMNLGSNQVVIAGEANLYSDNDYMAEHGEISFYLYDDYSGIDFFVAESSEWAYLRGHYGG